MIASFIFVYLSMSVIEMVHQYLNFGVCRWRINKKAYEDAAHETDISDREFNHALMHVAFKLGFEWPLEFVRTVYWFVKEEMQ